MVEGGSPGPAKEPLGVDPLLGRTLNERFRILEAIGSGGMGRVYKAIQAPLDRVVALKVLNPNFPVERDPAFKRRFLLEASMTSRLRHPNTVTVIDYGQTDDGIFYIVMELLEGKTLAEVLAKEKTLPWMRVLDITQQISRSLREAHKNGIVHRDLKPANVMLLAEEGHDVVKVLDFGLVKSFAPDPNQVDPEVTQNGMFLGSPQYMAPEQARNQANPRSDIYSLGILTYQMLCGRPPFLGKDYLDVIFQHMKELPKPPRVLRPDLDIPPDVEAVILKCLEKNPEARYASMDELLEALRFAASVSGMSGTGAFSMGTGITRLAAAPTPPPLPHFSTHGSHGVDTSDAVNTMAIDISDEGEPNDSAPPMFASVQRKKGSGAKLPWPWIGFGAAIAIGFAAMGWWGAHSGPRLPPPGVVPGDAVPALAVEAKEPTDTTRDTAPGVWVKTVKFHVTSEPSGARIFMGRKQMGITPALFELPAGTTGTASAELVFLLDGYPAQAATAGGSGDVMLMQKLQKRVFVRVPSPLPRRDELPDPVTADPASASGRTPVEVNHFAKASLPLPPPPVAVAPAPDVLPFGEGMTRPQLLSESQGIVFPREAVAAKAEGTMVVRCVVTLDGSLQRCRVVKSVPYMEEPVLDALRSRRYRPATYQGKPVAVDYVFTMRLVPPRR